MARLTGPELAEQLETLKGWTLDGEVLHRKLVFADFSEAWGFMSRVALVAEKMNHHPDWSNSWNTVEIAITSHDESGVTDQCIQLAAAVDDLV